MKTLNLLIVLLITSVCFGQDVIKPIKGREYKANIYFIDADFVYLKNESGKIDTLDADLIKWVDIVSQKKKASIKEGIPYDSDKQNLDKVSRNDHRNTVGDLLIVGSKSMQLGVGIQLLGTLGTVLSAALIEDSNGRMVASIVMSGVAVSGFGIMLKGMKDIGKAGQKYNDKVTLKLGATSNGVGFVLGI